MRRPFASSAACALVAFVAAAVAFWALPMLWLVTAPFDSHPGLDVSWPDWTLENFRKLSENPYAFSSLKNSLYLAVGTMLGVTAMAALAASPSRGCASRDATRSSTGCCCSARSSPAPRRWCRSSS